MLVGSIGGETQIQVFQQWNADVVVCGETSEWQMCEYVRDAISLGLNKALVIVGHALPEFMASTQSAGDSYHLSRRW